MPTDQTPTRTTNRAGGMPDAPLPDMSKPARRYSREVPPISHDTAKDEPPAERVFPESPPPPPPPPPNDVTFTRGPARRPQPPVSDPLLQWATGLQTKERRIYAGWLIEAGKLDALDGAMEQAGFRHVTIKHGSGNLVTHWAVETANVFVVADGAQSIGEMKHTTERYGLAFGWTRKDGRAQSQLKCRVFLQELLQVGYADPLLLTIRGTVTGDLIEALTQQYEVLDAVDAFRQQAGKAPYNPPFYACSIPLGPGPEVSRGTGNATREIAPIVANIPAPVTKEYILAHWIKRPWLEVIESIIDATLAWSETMSAQLAAGEDQAGAAGEEL